MPASVVQVDPSVNEEEDCELESYQEEMEHTKVESCLVAKCECKEYQLCYLILFLLVCSIISVSFCLIVARWFMRSCSYSQHTVFTMYFICFCRKQELLLY